MQRPYPSCAEPVETYRLEAPRELARRWRKNPAERVRIEAWITNAGHWDRYRWVADGAVLAARITPTERKRIYGTSVYGRPRVLAGTSGAVLTNPRQISAHHACEHHHRVNVALGRYGL